MFASLFFTLPFQIKAICTYYGAKSAINQPHEIALCHGLLLWSQKIAYCKRANANKKSKPITLENSKHKSSNAKFFQCVSDSLNSLRIFHKNFPSYFGAILNVFQVAFKFLKAASHD